MNYNYNYNYTTTTTAIATAYTQANFAPSRMLPHARKPLNRHTKSISSRDEESALNEDFYENNEEKKNKLSNQFNSFFTIFLSILLFGTFLVHYYTSLSSVEEKVYELIPSIPQVMPMQSYIKGKHNNFVSLNYTNNGGIHEESRDNENKYNTVKNKKFQ